MQYLNKPLNSEHTLSQTIYFLRWFLIMAVVFFHANYNSVDLETGSVPSGYRMFTYIFSTVFQRLPALVLFSGYLFFKSGFSNTIYQKKIKSRIKTLLIPYLFWNTVSLAYILFSQLLLLKVIGRTPRSTLVWQYSLHDWYMAYWGECAASQFWFIQNLMMLVILSPIFYLLVRYLKFFGVIITAIPWLFLSDTFMHMQTYSFFFFAIGAWFALEKKDFVKIFSKYWILSGVIFLLIAIWQVIQWKYNLLYIDFLHKIATCSSVVFIIGLFGKLIGRGRIYVNESLCKSSFFIFAAHFIPLYLIKKLCLNFIPQTSLSFFVTNIFNAGIIILLCILVYKLLHRFTPRFLAFITGGR